MSLLNEPDGTPNTIGRAFMMAVLLSVPIGLVINLLPASAGQQAGRRDSPPPQHTSSSDSWCSASYSSSPPTLA